MSQRHYPAPAGSSNAKITARIAACSMKIAADPNIPFVREAFSVFGEIALVSGREISPTTVRDADILLVRSVTPVNEALLAGSHVKFVATATIGTDHVDERYLVLR